MQFLNYVIPTLINLYIWVLILRIWMQWVKADFYNPIAQLVVRVTHPIVKLLRRFIPPIGPVDTASFVLAWLLMIIKILFIQPALGLSLKAILGGLIFLLIEAGTLVFYLLIIIVIMSWLSPGKNPFVSMIYQLMEPMLSRIRRFLPSLGMIDFSAMILIFILYGLRYLAADALQWIDMVL